MSEPTEPRFLGLSHDQRTNRWEITCPKCGNRFTPRTTMLIAQFLECPKRKCGASMVAKYTDKPTCTLLPCSDE